KRPRRYGAWDEGGFGKRSRRSSRPRSGSRRAARLFAGEQAAGSDVHAGRSGGKKDLEKFVARISVARVSGWKFGVCKFGAGVHDERRRLCRRAAEKMGFGRTNFLCEGERGADAGGFGSPRKRSW